MPENQVNLLTALLAAIVTMWTTYLAAKRRNGSNDVADDGGVEHDRKKPDEQA